MFRRISILISAIYIVTSSCNNEDKQKQPTDIPKDSTAVGKTAVDSTNISADTAFKAVATKKTENKKEASAKTKELAKEPTEKIKSNAPADAGKNATHKTDSAVTAKKMEAPVAKNEPAAAANSKPADSKSTPASVANNSKSFAPKYGLIPWDANENNITAFKNAFPDLQTLVKVNFDADPDAQMQSMKTQIIAALKKAGYKNVSDQSQTFHPARIPKDIHYELQRDGSVVIWLPPNTQ